ncbi:(R)-specific enoyl-CoA hydratase [uncultured Gammaproteobacteria bacterium]
MSTDAEMMENVTYDEMTIGQSASITRTVTRDDIALFGVVSGDYNPAHFDDEYAAGSMFKQVIAHGMFGGGLVSAVLGTKLPGLGAIYMSQEFRFRRPVNLGDTITATVIVKEKRDEKKVVVFDCKVTNQDGKDVITGTAEILPAPGKIRRVKPTLPEVKVIR